MDKKKKLRKIALWLFIISIVCFPLIAFIQDLLKACPVILNLANILLIVALIGGLLGAVIILFISLLISEKKSDAKVIKSLSQKNIVLCPICGSGSKRVGLNKIYCVNCNSYYRSDRFNIKDGEQLSDSSKKTEPVFCSLIKQEQKYKSIEDALEILQKDNYVLQNIRTSGEFSSHDCVASFSHEYSSVDELKKCANDDFDKEKKNTAAEIDWSDTIFTVKNKDTGFKISFYYGEHSGSSNLSAWITKVTKSYWDNVVEELFPLIEKNNSIEINSDSKE